MANELSIAGPATGSTLYAIRQRDSDRKVWSVAASDWVSFTVADYANYAIPLTETPAGLRIWRGDIGDTVASTIIYMRQVGASPSIANDKVIGGETYQTAGGSVVVNGFTEGASTAMAAAVWDADAADHATAGTFGAIFSGVSTGVITVLARLGGWAGSGINTILGAFRAMIAKQATIPTDISSGLADGPDPATDSLQAMRDSGVSVDSASLAGELADALAGQSVNVRSGLAGEVLDLYRADAYTADSGRSIRITQQATETHWPTRLDSVAFYAKPTRAMLAAHPSAASLGPVACSIVQASGSAKSFDLALTAAHMASLTAGQYLWWAIANKDGEHDATVRAGTFIVRPDPGAT